MNDTCFEYYKIDTCDIWEFECNRYLKGYSDDDHISKLKERYEEVIIYTNEWQKKEMNTVTGSAFTDTERFDNQEHKGYFDRNIGALRNAKTLKDKLALNYFMIRDEMYSFLQTIYINPNHKDFDYWFSLKLSQYSDGLKYVNEFLDHSLNNLFDNNINEFKGFLKILTLQYEVSFGPSVVKMVSKWIENTTLITVPNTANSPRTEWEHMTSVESAATQLDIDTDQIDFDDELPNSHFNPFLGNVIERNIDWGDSHQEIDSFEQKKDNNDDKNKYHIVL